MGCYCLKYSHIHLKLLKENIFWEGWDIYHQLDYDCIGWMKSYIWDVFANYFWPDHNSRLIFADWCPCFLNICHCFLTHKLNFVPDFMCVSVKYSFDSWQIHLILKCFCCAFINISIFQILFTHLSILMLRRNPYTNCWCTEEYNWKGVFIRKC